MHPLLETEAPGLAIKLEALSPTVWRQIFSRACLQASDHLAELGESSRELLQSLRIHGFLSPIEVTTAISLAEAADAKYFERNEHNAGQAEKMKWFSEARLLTAMAVGFRGTQSGDSAQALYELFKTCDEPSELIKIVESDVNSVLK
jgi:hypothetical protein